MPSAAEKFSNKNALIGEANDKRIREDPSTGPYDNSFVTLDTNSARTKWSCQDSTPAGRSVTTSDFESSTRALRAWFQEDDVKLDFCRVEFGPDGRNAIHFAHILLPQAVRNKLHIIAKSEFLLGLPYGSLNMDSRLLLMPLKSDIHAYLDGDACFLVSDLETLKEVLAYLEEVYENRKTGSRTKYRLDLWRNLLYERENSPIRAGVIHMFRLIPSQKALPTHRAIITGVSSPFRSHLIPIATVLNTLMSVTWQCGGDDLYRTRDLADWRRLKEEMRQTMQGDLDAAGQSDLCDVLMQCLDAVHSILELYPSNAANFKQSKKRGSTTPDTHMNDLPPLFSNATTIDRDGSFDGVNPSTPTPSGGRRSTRNVKGATSRTGESNESDPLDGSICHASDLATAWREKNATPPPPPSTHSKTSAVRQRIWSSLKTHIPRVLHHNVKSRKFDKENTPLAPLAAKKVQSGGTKVVGVTEGTKFRRAFVGWRL